MTDEATPLTRQQQALIDKMAAFPYPRVTQAARDLAIKEQTARKWVSLPHIKEALSLAYAKDREEVSQNLEQRILAMGDSAIAVKAKNLQSDNPSLKARESTWVLERILGRLTEHSDVSGEVLVRQYIGVPLDEV